MCNCVVDVTAKVATHLESQGIEIVGTPVMDAALMEACEEVGGHDAPVLPVLRGTQTVA